MQRASLSLRSVIVSGAALLTALSLAVCGGDAASDDNPAADASGVMQKNGLTLTPKSDSPAFANAKLSLNKPSGDSAEAGKVAFEFDVQNFNLGAQTPNPGELANSDSGQHIHLIVNNSPYSAHYESSFESELQSGRNVILAFLSRSYHESVKADGAFVLTQLNVGEGESEPADLSAPHLFYSRPKGTYENFSGKLLLDFYLANTQISADGNKVVATINGTSFTLTEWKPYVIEGLEKGEVQIDLELVDANGKTVPGPFNKVSRTVTLK